MKTNIKYYGVPLVVEFKIEGKYIPATREDPAEEPEIIIKSICAEDSEIDLQDLLDWDTVEEIIKSIEI